VLFMEISVDAPVGLIVTSGFFGSVFGIALLVWGLRSRSEALQARGTPRICPSCARNLSFIPGAIRVCPYCGNPLTGYAHF
jgi:hypothetical protein